MLLLRLGNHLFFGSRFMPRADHDRGTVSIVGTDINATVSPQSLKTDPDIRLDILDQVAQVDGTIGVRQRRRDQYPSFAHNEAHLTGDPVNPLR